MSVSLDKIVTVKTGRKPQRTYVIRSGESMEDLVDRTDTNDCEYFRVVLASEPDVVVCTSADSYPRGRYTVTAYVEK